MIIPLVLTSPLENASRIAFLFVIQELRQETFGGHEED